MVHSNTLRHHIRLYLIIITWENPHIKYFLNKTSVFSLSYMTFVFFCFFFFYVHMYTVMWYIIIEQHKWFGSNFLLVLLWSSPHAIVRLIFLKCESYNCLKPFKVQTPLSWSPKVNIAWPLSNTCPSISSLTFGPLHILSLLLKCPSPFPSTSWLALLILQDASFVLLTAHSPPARIHVSYT